MSENAKFVQSENTFSDQSEVTVQKMLDSAVQQHQAGRLSEAERGYETVLRADPVQPVALHFLGVIALQRGKSDLAVDLITKSVKVKPDYHEAHYNLGNALRDSKMLREAITSYHNAIAINPNYIEAHVNAGITHKNLGNLDEAVASFRRALAIEPGSAKAHVNLGNALKKAGKLDEAIASFRRALDIEPASTRVHVILGNVLKDFGQFDEAIASFRRAIAIEPESAKAHFNLGNALKDLGNLDEAVICHRKAVSIDPQNDFFWDGFARALEIYQFNSVDGDLWRDLLQLLDRPSVNPFHVSRPIISALRHHPNLLPILESMRSDNAQVESVFDELAEQLSEIPLFLRIMELIPIADLEIERMLAFIRRNILKEIAAGITSNKSQSFGVALALQCFTNEYIYPETGEETAEVERLRQEVGKLVDRARDVPPLLVSILGAYRPLYIFSWAQQLSEREWIGDMRKLIGRQIFEPLEERALRSQIPRLTSIQNSVSNLVREQYEENPYPRWIRYGTAHKGETIGDLLQSPTIGLDLGDYESPKSPEILVAGCGTGQQALSTASMYSNARVLAVDLSLNSLSYAKRKTEELNLSNIEYAQGDIIELNKIGRHFDLIECVGVLHHLGDPLAGWQVLVNLLRPEGLMKIGLYSESARQDIVCGQTLVAEKGFSSTPRDIRQCRQDVISMAKDGSQNMERLCSIPNFFSLSECRDLLFHVQEHRFTLPNIEAILRTLNLEFLGFQFRDKRALSRFQTNHQGKRDVSSISLWHEFELMYPDTFLGMYQFWCKKLS